MSAAAPSAARVLVVEDAADVRMLAARVLRTHGHDVLEAADGEQGVTVARAGAPDVVVLDIALPGIDGLEVCRRLREFTDAYVVMLTARDDDAAKVAAFDAGADDFVTKPVSPSELLARVQAMLRRPRAKAAERPVSVGELEIDPAARRIERDGEPVHLTRTEWSLLLALLEAPGVARSREELLARVWGPDWFGDDHVVDVHMSNLRRKLGPEPLVTTVRGFGYRAEVG